MDYQNLWFSLKEELIEFRNKGDIAINDLIEKMDKMEIVEFNTSKLSRTTMLCEESKEWFNFKNIHKCNICGGELYLTGTVTLAFQKCKEYKCKKCCNVILK